MANKKVDLPPKGATNPDPITKEPGAHPIETGVGAALGGAAAGMAAGAAAGAMGAGPVGAAVGGAVGIVAGALGGGLGGKAVGEMIDPTTEDRWVNEYYHSEKPVGRTVDDYRAPYHYGLTSRRKYEGKRFEDVESDLRSGWESTSKTSANLKWDDARPAIRHAYCRTVDIHDAE